MASRTPALQTDSQPRARTKSLRPLPVLGVLVLIVLLVGGGWVHQTMSDGLTPAAQRGDAATVNSILRWWPDPNRPDIHGEAPLPAAVKSHHFDIAESLLRAGADPNGKIYHGSNSMLTEAISQGQFTLAHDLIAHGAKINPPSGDSPLAAAIGASSTGTGGEAAQMVNSLLSHGADVNPSSGPTPLLVAARMGRPDLIQMLVSHGAKADSGESGNRALIAAALGSSAEAWNLLWKLGARPNGHDAGWARGWAKLCLDSGWVARLKSASIDIDAGAATHAPTALILSLADAPRVRALLQLGASPETQAMGGDTALILAGQGGSPETIPLLLAHGAHIDERGFSGTTALLEATDQYKTDTVRVLLAAGANPNAVNNQGVTGLMNAVKNGDLSSLDMLLARRANPNAADNVHGWTPLMLAIQTGHPALVPVLLSHGTQVNARDAAGETALFIAARRPDPEPTAALLQAGADRNIPNNQGATPLQEADRLHHAKVAALLKEAGGH